MFKTKALLIILFLFWSFGHWILVLVWNLVLGIWYFLLMHGRVSNPPLHRLLPLFYK